MTRPKRKTGEAKDFNEDFEDARQTARDSSGKVVSITPAVEMEKKMAKIREVTAEFNRLKAEGKAINDKRKACLETIDAEGLDRHEFKALVKLLEVDEDKRALKSRTRALFLKAHNLPEQIEMFAEADGTTPAESPAETDGSTGSPALDAALANGFLTEEELARNREFDEDGDTRDDPDEDDGLDELEPAGVEGHDTDA